MSDECLTPAPAVIYGHACMGGRRSVSSAGPQSRAWNEWPRGGAGRGMRSSPLAGMSGRTRRSEEFVEQGHNGDADDQQRAELDGEFLFHFLDVAFQFSSGNLKVGLDFVNVVL